MLSIAALRSGQEAYYLDLAKEDYYLDGGEPAGRWFGDGATALGLHGTVQREALVSLAAGLEPETGRPLVQAQAGRQRQPGWDLTLSAPKSVSVIWALAGQELRGQIQRAHDSAVEDALQYMSDSASFARRGRGGRQVEAAWPVVALFQHGTSRAQDPQLHTHALWQNVGVRADGTTGTVRSRDLYVHQLAGGAVYRASLSHRLVELGFELRAAERSFEVAGVPGPLCEHFSTRRRQILDWVQGSGRAYSPQSAELAALATRQVKGHFARELLFDRWASEAHEYSVTETSLGSLRGQARRESPQAQRARVEEAFKESARALAESKGYFSQASLVAAALPSLAPGTVEPRLAFDELRRCVREELVEVGHQAGHHQFTTPEHLARERSLLATASELSERSRHEVREHVLEGMESVLAPLSDEQRAAVQHVTLSGGDLALVDGLPGVGKTRMLDAAREAWERSGYSVVGVAVSRAAALALEEGSGIASSSVRSLQMRIRRQRKGASPVLGPRSILVVDESTMVGTADLSELLENARRVGAKVVLCGGTGQLPAIQAGGAFDALIKRYQVARISTIRRQTEQWERDAIEQFAQGDVRGALTAYASQGRVAIETDSHAAQRKLIEDWSQQRTSDPRETAIITGTNSSRFALNAAAQHHRKLAGELGSQAVAVGEEQAYKGDLVSFRSIGLLDGTPVTNGDVGVVTGVRRRGVLPGNVEFDVELRRAKSSCGGDATGRVCVTLRPGHGLDLSLGYASTVHRSQGQTVERAFVLPDAVMTTRESTFVAMTRATSGTSFYLDQEGAGEDLSEFTRAASRRVTRQLAIDEAARQEQLRRQHIAIESRSR